jgi:large subunit ribosomal protein L9
VDVILLERIAKLGQIGEVVRVRDGFARNFLLPQGKALRATDGNRTKFESMKSDLEARNLEKKGEAETVAKKLDGQTFVVIRQAGEGGQLYGSVSTRDIASALETGGFHVNRNQITLNIPVKSIGMHKMPVELHGEVEVEIVVNVARNEDEAVRQARGEDLTLTRTDEEEDAAQAKIDAEKFFEAPPAEVSADSETAKEAEAAAEEKPKAKRAKKADAEPAEGEAKPAKEKKAKKEKAKKE